jgi:hypothetical protein
MPGEGKLIQTPARIQKAKALSIAVSLSILVICLGINLFSSHESSFVEIANTSIPLAILLFAAVLTFRLRTKIQDRKEANQVWLWFGIGLVLYALAEAAWLVYLLAGEEVPYPGLPDLIYIGSYACWIAALVFKYRLLNVNPAKKRLIILWSICGIVLILTMIFIIVPILSGAAETNFLEILMNLFYSLADCAILGIALYLIFALWGGRISSPWILIGAGALILALADIVFVYASWNGLFYPGNQINSISAVADMGYIAFELLFASGVFMQTQLILISGDDLKSIFASSRDKAGVNQQVKGTGQAEEKGLLLTDKNNRLVYVSDSLRDLYRKFGAVPPQVGQPLGDVLVLDGDSFGNLINEVIQKTVLRKQIELSIDNKPFPFLLFAIARLNQAQEYDGMDLSVSLYKEGISPQLKEEIRFVETGNSILAERWEKLARFKQIDPSDRKILAYLFSKMIAFSIFAARLTGVAVAQKLSDVFNAAAQKGAVGVRFENSVIEYETPPDVKKMQSLVDDIIQHSQGLVSKASVDAFLNYFDTTMPMDILEAVKKGSQTTG